MAKKAQAGKLEVQNATKTLLANIRFMGVDNPIRSLVITSSIPNEGKSTVSANLAQAIATSGKRVLLVECDMRRRSIADNLGLHARSGLYAVLSGQVSLESAVLHTPQRNMFFLDVEPHIPNPVDILASKSFRGLVQTMEEHYDFVIFDTPPVSAFVDAAVLSALVDATVLVVRENFTKRQDILDAYEQLKKAEANVIGVVMNFCETESSEYYYAYYNKDGKRVRKSDRKKSSFEEAPQLPARNRGGFSVPTGNPKVQAAPGPGAKPQRSAAAAGTPKAGGAPAPKNAPKTAPASKAAAPKNVSQNAAKNMPQNTPKNTSAPKSAAPQNASKPVDPVKAGMKDQSADQYRRSSGAYHSRGRRDR